MKRIASLIIALATVAFPVAASARSIVEVDHESDVTSRVISGKIFPLVEDHQAEHDVLSGRMIMPGTPEAKSQLETKITRNSDALRRHCDLHRHTLGLSTNECGYSPSK